MARLRMNQAISRAISEEMDRDERIIVLGEDVAVAEGPFKTSEGLLARFGSSRVRDTPISEMGFVGAAVGAAMTGLVPVVEIMFVEFLGVALDQLVTEAAMMRHLSADQFTVPLVVRASVGSGLGFGCQHSQTLERWMFGTPGLKIAAASGARSAYELLKSAIRDPDPVVLLEPRALYGAREEVPGDVTVRQLGRAEVVQAGSDATIVTLGQTVGVAKAAAGGARWSADIIDLRTLLPWDQDTVLESVSRTGRLVIVEENQYTGGWGAHIAAHVAGVSFGDLRAPVLRITAPDVHVPYTKDLEERFLPSPDYVASQVEALISTDRIPPHWWEAWS
jgi:acetoin:2,6-dichlorophenolindophenol oxidoreductase subunit beta